MLVCPSNLLPIYNSLDKPSCLNNLLAKESLSPGCTFKQTAAQTRSEVISPKVFFTRKDDRKGLLNSPSGTQKIINHTIVFTATKWNLIRKEESDKNSYFFNATVHCSSVISCTSTSIITIITNIYCTIISCILTHIMQQHRKTA